METKIEAKPEKNEVTEDSQIKYRVRPRYGTYLEEDKVILQVALPGVDKADIQMKALKDYFTLKAKRQETLYTLDLDFGVKIEPEKTHSHFFYNYNNKR